MNTVIKLYEQALVTAINTNMFTFVEPHLLKGSNLYKAQVDLVKNLYNQGVHENYVSSKVEKIEQGTQKGEYNVYVAEEI